jgi:UDP-2-acetamido-2-deoxy-ribo-hexuluronate aminotransferase
MTLHMVDVSGQYRRIKKEIDAAVQRVMDSGQFILGKEVGEFECQVAGYLGVKYAVGCASGTDALQIAMMALDIGPGDEVITTPFTFVATTETIVLLGARPVYVDIDPRTYNIDPSLIESVITAKTKAIIPVHLYGQSADMDPIMEVARKHNLKVIEDAAQAIGASYKARKVCTFGDIGCISFFPSKNLGAFGDAGMVVTNDAALAGKMKMISMHGSKVRYIHEIPGVNSRLDTLQAVVLSVKLKYLEQWNTARQKFAARYDELLNDSPCTLPYVSPAGQHIFHQYTLRAPDRNALAEHLKSKGIPHAIYYPIPLHVQPAFQVAGSAKGDFPVTEKAADEVLSLPMHTELTDDQQKYISSAIKEFYKRV